VIHYSVANIPGTVPRTSTFALTGATLPFIIQIANKGVEKALLEDKSLLAGLNSYQGKLTCEPVAKAMNMEYIPALQAFA
jgi:alanine dehydrogenase